MTRVFQDCIADLASHRQYFFGALPKASFLTISIESHLERRNATMVNAVNLVKYTYSTILLIFSVIIVCSLIFEEQTSIAQNVHPALAFILLWVALIWLSMVEGSQASMVGLPPIDRSLYKESHPISHAICEVGHKGDNLDRYLMGRQFMVLACVFTINNSGAPIKDAEVLGLPDVLINIFLGSGLAMILLTCMIGQLNTQVNASHCMLDYINTHFATFTVYVAMAIEASGLLHASYLIQMIVAALAGKPIESNEPPRSGAQNLFFWGRVLMSTGLLIAALIFTFAALFDGKTTMYESIPSTVSLILTLILWSVVGMLEAMQIAFFAVSKLTVEERNASAWSKRTCDLLFKGDGRNLAGFMVGRQLCVVSCFFFAARATTMDIAEGESNVMGVPDAIQEFFNTGLLGAFITTIVASIAWQLVASAFPMAFLSNPITYILLVICLALESTGICAGAWVLAHIHKTVAGFQKDEVYVGTAEERAALGKGEASEGYSSQVGHLTGGAFPASAALPDNSDFEEDASQQMNKILGNIKDLREQMMVASSAEEKSVYEVALKREVAAMDKLNKIHGGRFDTTVADLDP